MWYGFWEVGHASENALCLPSGGYLTSYTTVDWFADDTVKIIQPLLNFLRF